ncbi:MULTISPECIES: AI-2E family transporter [unclassified Roseovarius]|uniref:AI-2E family transporter n=1 Tax=unclassified Roseovarius TaxID=2614913 RepID=UPI00273DB7D9|nr:MULTISPECIES: AI-2E family transporter [unclassified Roseovarius]
MEEDIKALKRGVTALITISLFVICYFAKDLLLPIVLGFLISLTLSPISRSLQKLGLPSVVAASFLIFVATSAAVGAGYFAGGIISSWSRDLPRIAYELKVKLSDVSETIDAVKDVSDEVENMTATDPEGPQKVVIEQPGLLDSAVTVLASTATTLIVAMILAFFLLASGNMFYAKLVQVFETISEKKRALATVYDIERRVSAYLLTITIINASLGLVVAVALYLLGLEHAYVWGIAAFLLNYLPILGGLAGTIMVGVHAIVYFDSLTYALAIPVTYQALTAIEANFITPYLVGRRMELNIVAVFLTVVVWAWLWGVAGALMAVPFLLVFKVVCDNFEALNTIGIFLGGPNAKPKAHAG